MRQNTRVSYALGLAVLGLGMAGREEAALMDAPLAVSIAVPEHRGVRAIVGQDDRSHFHVALRNTSSRPVTIWREWCSFGHDSLSFQGRTAVGTKTTPRRRPVPFLQNIPDPVTLAPGEILVYDVAFGSGDWEGFPLPPSGTQAVVTLRAVFEIRATPQAAEHGVWTGQVVSESRDYRFESRGK